MNNVVALKPHCKLKENASKPTASKRKGFYRTDRYALCVDLCKGDHRAASLLWVLVRIVPYGKARVKGRAGCWSANRRDDLMEAARMTEDQYDRAMRKLVKLGLIERVQNWFNHTRIPHIRLTERTKSYLQEATTVRAVREIMSGEEGVVSRLRDLWEQEAGSEPQPNVVGYMALFFEELMRSHLDEDLSPHIRSILALGIRDLKYREPDSLAADMDEETFSKGIAKVGVDEWIRQGEPDIHPLIELVE